MGEAEPPSVEVVFAAAMGLSAPDRAQYLVDACRGNQALRSRVEALLNAHDAAASFLDRPASSGATIGFRPGHAPAGEGPGTQVGPYQLLQLIGEGGFGSVFLAEQEQPVRRRVALKIIKLGMDTRQVIARFEAERQALAMMDHPNIAKVFDAGATGTGRPYFVMELVRGEPITEYCDKNSLDIPDRLALFMQVCQAVQHAHIKGLIHRDLKPSNILVSAQDRNAVAKVIDFGIAKATGQRLTDKTVFTEHRVLMGTPQYMSPEQAEGSLDIDTRADLYSLGVVLYELLTGLTPFDPDVLQSASHQIPRMIRELEPLRPSTRLAALTGTKAGRAPAPDPTVEIARRRRSDPPALRKALRADLDWIVMKALEKDRSRRYETADALALDILRHLKGEPVLAAPPSTAYRVRKFARRHKFGVGAASLVALTLVSGVIGTSAGMQKARHEADEARKARDEAETTAGFISTTLQGAGPSIALGRDPTMLREMMDAAADRIERGELREAPNAELRLRNTIGETYRQISQFDRARSMLEPAVALARSIYGPSHDQTATAINSLAVLLQAQGDLDGAEPFLRQALDIGRQLHPGDHPYVAAALSNLAGLLQDRADYAKAEPLMREAVTMWEHLYPGDHPDVATGLSNLASLLNAKGDSAGAESMYRRSLDMRRRLFPGDHPDVALDLNNLGDTLRARSDLAGAEPLLRESLEMRRRLYPGDSAAVSTALNNLATLLRLRSDLDAAEPLYRESLAMDRRLYPGDHPDVATDLRGLAALLLARGDPAGAEPAARESLEMFQRLIPGDHPQVAESLRSLAIVLQARGSPDAERYFGECLAMLRRMNQAPSPRLAGVLRAYAATLVDRSDLAGAEPLLIEALGILRRAGPDSNASIEPVLVDLADVYERLGRPADAEALWRELVQLREKSAPAGDWRLASARSRLGGSLALQKKFAEAEPLLVDNFHALKTAHDTPRSPSDRLREACERVVRLYEAWDAADRTTGGPGKPDQLTAWRQELVSIAEAKK